MDTIDGLASEDSVRSLSVSHPTALSDDSTDAHSTRLAAWSRRLVRSMAGGFALVAMATGWKLGMVPSDLFLLVGGLLGGGLLILSRLLFGRQQYPMERLISLIGALRTGRAPVDHNHGGSAHIAGEA